MSAIQEFYREHPRMVSSPFGGVEGIHEDLIASVMGELGIPLAGSALDVGCGRGFLVEWLRAQGVEAVGADFVVSRGGFPLARADAAALPFAEGAFDLVCCVDASEHFPEPGRAAAEFYRVLKPGGSYFLSAPNYGNVAGWVKWWCERFGSYERNTWAPFGRWQPQELEQPLTERWVRDLYSDAGFVDITCIGYGAEVGLGLFPWVDHPRMPERFQYRLQDLFAAAGPSIARVWPSSSLHLFWHLRKPL